MRRIGMALLLLVTASSPAWAGHTSFSVGVWSGPAYPYHARSYPHHERWRYPYRGPRTVFVYPAPAYVVPPPAVYSTVTPTVPTTQCRVFNGDAIIDGAGTPFYGRACIFTDGRWHIVP